MTVDDERQKHLREVERQKALLRVEETFPETEGCAACAAARQASGDPTDLCREHLARVYGV